MRKRETQDKTEYYLFSASGNMNAYCDNGEVYAHYGYDDAGQRMYKMLFNNLDVTTNAYGHPYLQLEKMTFYPNGYVNLDQYGNYTKHYYADAARIASKIGTGSVLADNLCDSLAKRIGTISENYVGITDAEELLSAALSITGEKIQADMRFVAIPEQEVDINYGNLNICDLKGDTTSSYEDALFFYHGNHLSSTQLITDNSGSISQAVLYTPHGLVIAEYRADWKLDTIPRFLFTGMERDDESGLDYMSARYYSSDYNTFNSRDLLFEKYFWMSPYAYCGNNPVSRTDPTGMEWDIDGIKYEPGQACPTDAAQSTKDKWETMNKIYTTANGQKAIDEMNKEGVLYKVSSDAVPCGILDAGGEYVSNQNGMGGTIYLNGNNKDIDILSHEMFHGYQDLHGQGGGSIHNEVEANLFSISVQAQYRKSQGRTVGYVSFLFGECEDYNSQVRSMVNNNYSDDTMEALINGFKACSGKNSTCRYSDHPLRDGENSLIKNF